ncbi:MAG: hypothetical protein DRJ40_00925 [Thermoprotei archaeon]|nr:MAG: hypothetical protein DRJ40_00925 [Thermoprotei archaeon]
MSYGKCPRCGADWSEVIVVFDGRFELRYVYGIKAEYQGMELVDLREVRCPKCGSIFLPSEVPEVANAIYSLTKWGIGAIEQVVAKTSPKVVERIGPKEVVVKEKKPQRKTKKQQQQKQTRRRAVIEVQVPARLIGKRVRVYIEVLES